MRARVMVAVVSVVVSLAAVAQVVERPRPAGWENLVPGGRFMDRFEPSAVIGNGWTTNCWGGDNVKPRDIRNGIEDAEYSYWGGNITKGGRLFFATCRTDGTKLDWFKYE